MPGRRSVSGAVTNQLAVDLHREQICAVGLASDTSAVGAADWQAHKKYCKRWVYSRFNKLSNFVESRYHADAEHSEVFKSALEAAKAKVGGTGNMGGRVAVVTPACWPCTPLSPLIDSCLGG